MTEDTIPPPPKHRGEKFRKDGSGNPGGKKRVAVAPAQPPDAQPVNAERKRDGRFTAGNPGKPKGARHKTTVAMEALLDGEGEALTRKAIELAKGGDIQALRLCMDRLLPPRRDRSVNIDMPKIEKPGDLVNAAASITANVAAGEITPSEASDLVRLVEGTAKAIEVHEFAERLAKLEQQMASKGNP